MMFGIGAVTFGGTTTVLVLVLAVAYSVLECWCCSSKTRAGSGTSWYVGEKTVAGDKKNDQWA